MRSKYKIRNTGLDILDILQYLAKGSSPEQIITRHPDLKPADIINVAQQAYNIVSRQIMLENYYKLSEHVESAAQKKHASIITPGDQNPLQWTENEQAELTKLITNNARLKEIAKIFKRSKLAVKIQLEKMGIKTKEDNQ